MRILMVHNRYRVRGGEDEVCDAERRLLQAHGHDVDLYEDHNDRLDQLNPVQSAVDSIWSRRTYTLVSQKLSEKKYDILHVHNFLPLISPSVYYAAQEKGVPVVQTLHNYRLLCPNALFFRQGSVCENCLGKAVPLASIQHGCYRENRAATGMVVAMNGIHRGLQTWTKQVDTYIALTEFVRQKYIEGGLPAEKIRVKPNFVDPDPGVGSGQGNYAIYVGRLSVEKGLDILLSAWEKLGKRLPLKIVGDGPLFGMVEAAIAQNPQIEWLGRRPMQEVYDLIGEAQLLVFPSKWYETFGLVAIEAFAKGTPVVGADIGAISGLVEDYKTGLLFEASNAESLCDRIGWLLDNPKQLAMMRPLARQQYEQKYTAEQNYLALLDIYTAAICPAATRSTLSPAATAE